MGKKYLISVCAILVLMISLTVITLTVSSKGQVKGIQASALYEQLFPTPLRGTILYVSNKSGNWEIYKRNLETKEEVNLTNNSADDMNPQVSPDGKFMVFYSNRKNETLFQNRNNQIYLMNLVTLETKQLTTDESGNYDPAFSPDGTKIVFKSTRYDGYGDIHIMNADGTNQVNMTPQLKDTEEWDPVFNNTGHIIYFVSRLTNSHDGDELFQMNADGTNVTRLTSNAFADWYPSVNPKTGQLTFISKRTKGSSDDVFVANPSLQEKTDITNILGNDNDPHWNQEGDLIIFINDHEGDYDLYVMKPDGTGIRKVEDMPGNELSPVFLPED